PRRRRDLNREGAEAGSAPLASAGAHRAPTPPKISDLRFPSSWKPGQLSVQMHGSTHSLFEVAEVKRFVLAVGVAGGVLQAEKQGWRAAEDLGERLDERDGAAAADVRRGPTVACFEGPFCCSEGRPLGTRDPPRSARHHLRFHLRTPRRIADELG